MGVAIRFEERRFLRVCETMAAQAPAFYSAQLGNPCFIIGVPRSGTSLLLKILLKHPDIGGFPQEANHLWHPKLYPWREQAAAATVPPYEVDPKGFTEASLRLWESSDAVRLRATFGAAQFLYGTPVFLNKTAMACFLVPHILGLFPDAKFIHVVRDGRAAAFSRANKEHQKMLDNRAIYAGRGFFLSHEALMEHAARAWSDSLLEMARVDQRFQLTARKRMLRLSYEALCAHPARELERLQEFLGVEDRPDLLQSIRPESQNQKFQTSLAPALRARLDQLTAPGMEIFDRIA